MQTARKMTAIAGAALSALVLAGLLLVPSSAARAGPPEPRELPGLREAPNIPVGSIFLRRALPGHPLPPPVEQDFPGPGAPGLDGRRAPGGGGCDKDVDLTGAISGLVAVAALDTGICTNADLDTYVDSGDNTYVVQAGGEEVAWTITDVTDPANPDMVGQWYWTGAAGRATYTPDVKTFQQDDGFGNINDYIVMGLERMKVRAYCGVVIYNVTDPAEPVFVSQYIGNTTNQSLGPTWCDTHNVFVENDASGEGQYIYATADGPNDLRVLDISGANGSSVANPVEIGRYVAPGANNDNYVHDVTVIDHENSKGRRVYLAYWNSGLVVLDAADVTSGTSPTPIIGPNDLDPDGFLNHHSFPSQDGNFVFIQDEFLKASGEEPVQMWDISDPTDIFYVDGLRLGTDVPVNPAHNLEIRYDIDPERLYVAWYKLGLQAWDFDSVGGGFLPPGSPAVFHQVQTEANDDEYSGAWGVRLLELEIEGPLYIFQSDRNFGLIVDCEGCATLPTPPTASFTYTCDAVRNCDFDGTGSSEGDAAISSYNWDFGDSTPAGSGSTTNHTYEDDGSYTVTLTVTDVDGEYDSASDTVTFAVSGGANDIYVWAIDVSDKDYGKGGTLHDLTTTVVIRRDADADGVDNDDVAVSSANVTIVVTRVSDGSTSSTTVQTDGAGSASYVIKRVQVGNYVSDVTAVTHATYDWNAVLDNVLQTPHTVN